ncbi:matrixin family metalloprotease [Curtobacterium flaccumfaciens]|nr:matrixin family metalloprotease [Curtobacterium flaccumfaciens]
MKLRFAITFGLGVACTAGLLAAPANADITCDDLTVTLSQLEAGCAVDVGDVIDANGALYTVPNVEESVTSSEIVEDGTPRSESVVVSNTSEGVAVAVGRVWTGSTGAVTQAKSVETRQAVAAAAAQAADQEAANSSDLALKVSCERTRKFKGYEWPATSVNWRYNDDNSKATYAYDAIKAGANKWRGTVSACGTTENLSSSNTPLGSTGSRPAVRTTKGCADRDSKNVVGWGSYEKAGVLARTCVWSRYGSALETDMKFNVSHAWSSTASCSGSRFDVQGIATHEWGHVFGLEDLENTNLVMEGSSGYCETSQRSLGLGDVLGIGYLY